MFHLSIDLIVLIIAVPVGLITFRRNSPLYLKLFPFFLLLTLIVELTGELFQSPGQNNLILFNLFSVTEFAFYTYFFREVIWGAQVKKIVHLLLYILPAICLLNIFFIQGPKTFHTYTYAIGCLVMVCLGITYFYQLFKNPEHVNLLREPAFWISAGIIFFFVTAVTVAGAFNYIASLPAATRRFIQQILLWVNTFFYILFIIAFLCKLNTRKSSPNT